MRAGAQTPAILAVSRAGVAYRVHEYAYDPDADAMGLDAAAKLGLEPTRVLKTLVVQVGGGHLLAVVPSDRRLDLRALGKGASLASHADAERLTGYVVGGISPLGARRRLPTLVDESALAFGEVVVNGGRRGLQLELAPADLLALTGGIARAIAADR
jgi:Cys-tRNA(Pro)/Cys-tRNA(Cys) deacylase